MLTWLNEWVKEARLILSDLKSFPSISFSSSLVLEHGSVVLAATLSQVLTQLTELFHSQKGPEYPAHKFLLDLSDPRVRQSEQA